MNPSSKYVLFSAAAGVMALAGGCQAPASSSASAAATPAVPAATTAIRSDVTDIHPMETATAPAQTAAYQVAAAEAIPQPITYSSSAPMTSITPPITAGLSYSARTPGAIASAGSTHTVRRGETLYSIARESYGSGKQWRKIALANPGVTPSTLKVGQSLIIP